MPAVPANDRPALLCFDGSDDALAAIARAAELLAPRAVVALTVWEPVASWAPYDPATILTAPLSKLADKSLGIDEVARELAQERSRHGIEFATEAGFQGQARVEAGKPWRVILEVAAELGAEPIVLGARGLGRLESALLGSVSSAVVFHAKRPVLVIPPEAQNPASSAADR